MSALPASAQTAPAPVLVLCRQCIQYVYEGTATCPHCGGEAQQISDRYRDGGYLALEAMQRIERAVERHG